MARGLNKWFHRKRMKVRYYVRTNAIWPVPLERVMSYLFRRKDTTHL